MTKCVSVLSGIHTRPPRSSPAAGMDRSNYGTKMKKTASETVEEVAGKLNLNFFVSFFCPSDVIFIVSINFMIIPGL